MMIEEEPAAGLGFEGQETVFLADTLMGRIVWGLDVWVGYCETCRVI